MNLSRLKLKLVISIVVMIMFFACNNAPKTKDNKEIVNGKTKEQIEEDIYVHDSMIIVKVSETNIAETPHQVDVRKIYDKPNAQVMIIKLEPGESLKEHITPVDVFFYILEGTADIMVGDEIKSVETDCLVESPKDIKHCIYNKSENVVRVMVVKAPKQTENSTIL